LKKRRGLFEDASNPSQPLTRDHADSPAREHTRPEQAEWQNVKYYGQNPQDMIYSNQQGDNDYKSLMSHIKPYDMNFTKDQQSYNSQDFRQGVGAPSNHYVEPSFKNTMPGMGNQSNQMGFANNQATIDGSGRPLRIDNQNRTGNKPFPEVDQDGFMTPQSYDGRSFNFGENQNKVKDMIMRDRVEPEPTRTFGYNTGDTGFSNQGFASNQADAQRSFTRAGPAKMLNMSSHDSRMESFVRPKEPINGNFNQQMTASRSSANYATPKSIETPSVSVARSGLNKFAPLEPVNGPPATRTANQFGQMNDSRFARDLSGNSPHQFLSKDPVLQSIGRPYY
jgi:hypothetical protein